MLTIVYTHASVVCVIFHCYMIRNKQFNTYSLHSMMLPVVLFAYAIKLNMLTMKGVIIIFFPHNNMLLCDMTVTFEVGTLGFDL